MELLSLVLVEGRKRQVGRSLEHAGEHEERGLLQRLFDCRGRPRRRETGLGAGEVSRGFAERAEGPAETTGGGGHGRM